MRKEFPRLLSEATLGPLTLRNRIVMPAMDQNNCTDDGLISNKTLQHYEDRAKGGAGLLILETSAVKWPDGATSKHQPSLSSDEVIPGLEKLAERAHKHGARMIVQACHHGRISGLDISRDVPVLVPSTPIPSFDTLGMAYNTTTEELMKMATLTGGKLPTFKEASREELVEIIEAFGEASLRIKKANLDGIEIHAAHGYLISTFLSRAWNRREDEWGGSIEKRARLLTEIIRKIRKKCGSDFAIVVRIDGHEYGIEHGITSEEASTTAAIAEEAGADAIHVSAISSSGTGVGFTEGPLPWERCQYSELAKNVKSAISIPVIAVGRIEPKDGERLIAENNCDFVAMGRQLLADPELPNNLINNTPEKIRPCINCFVCVAQNFWNGEPVCAVNPRLGNYEEIVEVPKKLKNIVVVGAGPAGLECARVASNRGHKVTILEQTGSLGGTALFSSLTTPKNGELINWFEQVLKDSEVVIRKNFLADSKSIMSFEPDVVVIATGSQSSKSNIKGSELQHVLSRDQLKTLLQESNSSEITKGRKNLSSLVLWLGRKLGFFEDMEKIRKLSKLWMPLGKNVVIIGGGLVGVELSHFLSERKRNVSVLETRPVMAPEMAHPRRWRSLHQGSLSGVKFHNNIQVVEIRKNSVVYIKDESECEVPADSVILAEGIEADRKLHEKFADIEVETHIIGDAESIGYIEGAVRSGNKVGQIV
ncbi:MAG: NAD(P)/FAD-dependent oxidoreductase [Acidimicrobiales bacterium]|nr:NAD(P)/FAD-dependent oxidoreductase [Acidimicrobiales bacterium]